MLRARMRSYELAAKMQLAVPEVTSLDGETAATHALYGLDRPESADFGRGCLLARRLLERGVRFVQLFSGGSFGNPAHQLGRPREHAGQPRPGSAAHRSAGGRPAPRLAAARACSTTRWCCSPPNSAARRSRSRPPTWSGWGAITISTAFRSGWPAPDCSTASTYGATDDFGYKAVENRVHWHDFHATVLHLLGIDHERLTFYHNGIRRRLTNVHGEVLQKILV